jgi:hypothetical protein
MGGRPGDTHHSDQQAIIITFDGDVQVLHGQNLPVVQQQ